MVPAQHEIQRRDSTIPLAVWTRSNASEHKDSVNFNGLDMSNETIEFSTFSSPDDSPRTVRWDHDAATTCSGKRRMISALSRHQSFGLFGKPGENRIGRIERGPFQIDRSQAPIGPIRTGLAA